MQFNNKLKITVIGLGYVGLPLAVALSKNFSVIGFDINNDRVNELNKNHDSTGEVDESSLFNSSLLITSDYRDIKEQDIYIIAVPTPVKKNNSPDFKYLKEASEIVGKVIQKNNIVVYESTVYPGVTEDFCGSILEKFSCLKSGEDFYLAYAPERINPGDKKHSIDNITKVISSQTKKISECLAKVYGSINNGNVFIAKDIKTAEAAKVIENTQRDINVAFINEITIIFQKMGISVYDVLKTAETKWNFLKFLPGFVGGHCIGVDPYYLAYASHKLGYAPEVILSGRNINERMSKFITTVLNDKLYEMMKGGVARILVLGVTFKENISDLRNSKAIDLINGLKQFGHIVDVHDPFASIKDAKKSFNIDVLSSLCNLKKYNCVVGVVAHKLYLDFDYNIFKKLLHKNGLIADIKNIWSDVEIPTNLEYWTL